PPSPGSRGCPWRSCPVTEGRLAGDATGGGWSGQRGNYPVATNARRAGRGAGRTDGTDEGRIPPSCRPSLPTSPIEQPVVSVGHPGGRQAAPAECAPHARLLLGCASEPLDRRHRILAVLLLGLDVDGVELERPIIERVVLPERVVDHVRPHGTPRHLHLDG